MSAVHSNLDRTSLFGGWVQVGLGIQGRSVIVGIIDRIDSEA
jgi:hypothetical protein